MPDDQRDWHVLLLGGPSGAGKSIVAERIGLRLGIPWLQVDDLRLALQRSRVTLPAPADTESLYYFADIEERHEVVWRESPERLRDALIAVGDVMSPAIEAVIHNHADQRQPVVIEGDGILPSITTRPEIGPRLANGSVRAVFLVESDETTLHANMLRRSRGIERNTEAAARTEARAKWLFGQWVGEEVRRLGLPLVESRPWDSLAGRVLSAAGAGPGD